MKNILLLLLLLYIKNKKIKIKLIFKFNFIYNQARWMEQSIPRIHPGFKKKKIVPLGIGWKRYLNISIHCHPYPGVIYIG